MQHTSGMRTISLVSSHFACLWFTRLIFLTLITYFFVHSHEVFQKVDNIIRANQMIAYGISALFLSGLLQMLYPLTHTRWKEIFDFQQNWHFFIPYAIRGFVFSSVLVLGGLLSGHMTWLGIYIKLDEVLLSISSIIIFSLSFFILMIFEEFILRLALERNCRPYLGQKAGIMVSTILFVSLKLFEFGITWFEVINFILLNLILSKIARQAATHIASAVFISSLFITSHILFGLPFLGQDLPGICLIRLSNDQGHGPEGGFAFTILLLIYIFFQKAYQVQRSRHQH